MTLVTQVPVIEMDGRRFYYTFIAGARKVIEHQVELNKINVFPVNDGDTGTNLASTIRAVVDSLHPHRSYKITADRIAETTLVNARGRVSAVRGLIARMLNINPIVSIDESGKAIVFGKTFNLRANMEKVMVHITKISQEKTIWNYIVLHANNNDAAQWYSEKMETLTNKKPASVVNISPIIGANTGIGAAAVALLFD